MLGIWNNKTVQRDWEAHKGKIDVKWGKAHDGMMAVCDTY